MGNDMMDTLLSALGDPEQAKRSADALLPMREEPQLVQVRIALIDPDPEQPRQDMGDLDDLTESISAHGILDPLSISPLETGRFLLVDGHRRLASAKRAGVEVVPAFVRTIEERQRLLEQLLRVLHRKDLHPMEWVRGCRRLMTQFGIHHQKDLARLLHKSPQTISETLKILSLPPEKLDRILPENQKPAILVEITRLPMDRQVDAIERAAREQLSSRDIRRMKPARPRPETQVAEPETTDGHGSDGPGDDGAETTYEAKEQSPAEQPRTSLISRTAGSSSRIFQTQWGSVEFVLPVEKATRDMLLHMLYVTLDQIMAEPDDDVEDGGTGEATQTDVPATTADREKRPQEGVELSSAACHHRTDLLVAASHLPLDVTAELPKTRPLAPIRRTLQAWADAGADLESLPEQLAGLGVAREHFVVTPGGSAANVVRAARRWGCCTALAGMVGRDTAGEFICAADTATGIDTTPLLRRDEGHTPISLFVVRSGHTEHTALIRQTARVRSLFQAREEAWNAYRANLIALCPRVLHLNKANKKLLDLITSLPTDTLVSCTLHSAPTREQASQDLLRLLERAQLVTLSDDVAAAWQKYLSSEGCADDEAACWAPLLKALFKHSPSLQMAIVTRGEQGLAAMMRGEQPILLPAWEANCLRDAIGAGDVFLGTLLAQLLDAGWNTGVLPSDILTLLEYSMIAAALNCERLGATGQIPLREEVMERAPLTSFHKPYGFLSNFHRVDVAFDGVTYPTVEHAYQASKTVDPEEREKIRQKPNPHWARQTTRRKGFPQRDDFEEVRESIMLDLLRQKYGRPDLRVKLLETGDRLLIEGNDWKDQYWGMCRDESGQWIGANRLGKLLMKVREECRVDPDIAHS